MQLKEWVDSLSHEQASMLLLDLLEEAIATEVIRMGSLSPYWEATGDPLVPGQAVWTDAG